MMHLGDQLDSNCCPSHLRRCGSDDGINLLTIIETSVAFYH
jgi:hypothetical protein